MCRLARSRATETLETAASLFASCVADGLQVCPVGLASFFFLSTTRHGIHRRNLSIPRFSKWAVLEDAVLVLFRERSDSLYDSFVGWLRVYVGGN